MNVRWAIKKWLDSGAPKEKILLGLAAYGRSYTIADSSKTNLGAPAKEGGAEGKYTRTIGFLSYYEICEKISQGWSVARTEEQKVPYAYSGLQWVGYDDQESLGKKVEMLNEFDLGGAMFWVSFLYYFT